MAKVKIGTRANSRGLQGGLKKSDCVGAVRPREESREGQL